MEMLRQLVALSLQIDYFSPLPITLVALQFDRPLCRLTMTVLIASFTLITTYLSSYSTEISF
jgi:hypothetical protein